MSFKQAYALLVGVGSYKHEAQLNIPISVADAQGVANVLRDPQYCGYPAEQVTLLHDAGATTTGILAALDQLASRTDAESTVFVFYCGHGDYGDDGQYYLTTHDTRVANRRVVPGSGISHGVLLGRLRAIPAQRLLLVFNSCHSGEISPSLGPGEPSFGNPLPDTTATALLGTGEGRIIITACREGQVSYIGRGQLSIFTQALVEGLQGKDTVSHNGYISAFDLYTHVYYAVTEAVTKQLGRVQQPELTIIKGIGPFAVSLFRGATSLGAFEDQAPLPEEVGAREVSPQQSQRLFQQIIKTGGGAYIGGSVHTGGGDFVGRDKITLTGERGVAIGGSVKASTIITGDRNVVGVRQAATLQEFVSLLAELRRLVPQSGLDADTAQIVEADVRVAQEQVAKPQPSRAIILSKLKGVAEMLTTAAGAAEAAQKLVPLAHKAAEWAGQLFR